MKSLTLLLFVLTTCRITAQDLNETATRSMVYRNSELFTKLEIDVRKYSFQNATIKLGLVEIANCQRKSNDNLGIGLLLAGIGASIVTIAVIGEDPEPILASSSNGWDIEFDFGAAPAIIGGSIIGATSGPFLIAGGKNKRKMKTAIRETKLLMQ